MPYRAKRKNYNYSKLRYDGKNKCPVCSETHTVYGPIINLDLHIIKQAQREALLRYAIDSKYDISHAEFVKKHHSEFPAHLSIKLKY